MRSADAANERRCLWAIARANLQVLGKEELALRKRPVDADRIDRVINSLVRQLESSGENESPSKQIGEMVMTHLAALDQVAFVRYASVYRDFREASDFNQFVEGLRPEPPVAATGT